MTEILAETIATKLKARVRQVNPIPVAGRITRVQGPLVRATLADARIGEECLLKDPHGRPDLRTDVVGLDGDEVLLAPCGDLYGLSSRAAVIPTGRMARAPVGEAVLGRVLDAFGQPLDGGAPMVAEGPLYQDAPAPLSRPPITEVFETGVRAIDGVLTLGEGQRVGLFGAAGVGKSQLLAQIVRGAAADRIVLGLIGERGREVADFINRDLGSDGLSRASVFVATSDRPASERLRAALAATAAAESFRAAGHRTLLLIDSVTRVARAIREIGLAAGEPPVRRGFTPSTFAMLPRLVERAGQSERAPMTAIYTVLVEGDDDADPVADEMRSLLDGHIILSRDLAGKGHFPAIDILRSSSRIADQVVTPDHCSAAREVRGHLAKLADVELLVQIGEYAEGSDVAADAALARQTLLEGFLRQDSSERSGFNETTNRLQEIVA